MNQNSHLLRLPVEIRIRIADYLFVSCKYIRVEREQAEGPDGTPCSRMKRVSLSGQLIWTCRRMHQELSSLLYASNGFDCSQHEGLKLLLQSIGPKNFSSIRRIVIDWEQLQDFAWALAKEDFNYAVSGLVEVELATWRIRVLGGTSFLWKQIKSYERQLCQSAVDICGKHAKLNIVVQQSFSKPGHAQNKARIKWRFITSETEISNNETIVPIAEELRQLIASADNETGGRGAQEMIDPF